MSRMKIKTTTRDRELHGRKLVARGLQAEGGMTRYEARRAVWGLTRREAGRGKTRGQLLNDVAEEGVRARRRAVVSDRVGLVKAWAA